MHTVEPISEAATRRAEQADPNGQRCLVENCPKERAVQLAYVFDRKNSGDPTMMRSIEWAWGLRKDTLNLDTRRNIFFLGASMLALYRAGKWALLPSEDIVDQYLGKPRGEFLGAPLGREAFPKISGKTFEYSFLPLCDMSTFGITRQNAACDPCSAAAYETHVHPFKTLPTLTSHIHPNFALLHLSSLLIDRMRDPYIANLTRTNNLAAKIARLSIGWCCPELPRRAKYDPTFLANPAPEGRDDYVGSASESDVSGSGVEPSDEDMDYQNSEGDSICTPPRRIRYHPPPSYTLPGVQSFKRPSCDLKPEEPAGEGDSKQRKRLKTTTPVDGGGGQCPGADLAESSESGWTKEAISSWARECSASPELKSLNSLPPPLSTTDV